jgi:HAD superfamily hydrolase (TIGR01509 family)
MGAVAGIGFDLDHTLAIDNQLERVAFLRLLETLLAQGGSTIGTLGDEIANIDDLLKRQRRGHFSIDEAVRRFVTARHVEPAEPYIESFRQMALEMVDEFVIALPGVTPTLAALQDRKIPVAVLTNGWNPLQARKAQRAGFAGPVLVSSEIGELKPARGAFERLLEALGTPADQTWYVGDDPRGDVAGAQALGMSTVWIDWEHKEYPVDQAPPSYRIHSFDRLLEVLPATVRVV